MRLRDWLRDTGIPAQNVARYCGKSPSLVSHWISGKRRPLAPDIAKIRDFTQGRVGLADWLRPGKVEPTEVPTPLWCELVCDICLGHGPGRFSYGGMPRGILLREAGRDGWRIKGESVLCPNCKPAPENGRRQ